MWSGVIIYEFFKLKRVLYHIFCCCGEKSENRLD